MKWDNRLLFSCDSPDDMCWMNTWIISTLLENKETLIFAADLMLQKAESLQKVIFWLNARGMLTNTFNKLKKYYVNSNNVNPLEKFHPKLLLHFFIELQVSFSHKCRKMLWTQTQLIRLNIRHKCGMFK